MAGDKVTDEILSEVTPVSFGSGLGKTARLTVFLTMKPGTLVTYPGLRDPTRRKRGTLLSVRGICAIVKPCYSGYGPKELVWCDVRTLEVLEMILG